MSTNFANVAIYDYGIFVSKKINKYSKSLISRNYTLYVPLLYGILRK